jgi:hypothetical protein
MNVKGALLSSCILWYLFTAQLSSINGRISAAKVKLKTPKDGNTREELLHDGENKLLIIPVTDWILIPK